MSAIRKLLFVFLVLAGIPFSVIQAQTVGEFNHSKYVSEIKNDRLAKDKEMLTDEVIGELWPKSVQKQYEYVRKRLQEALPTSG